MYITLSKNTKIGSTLDPISTGQKRVIIKESEIKYAQFLPFATILDELALRELPRHEAERVGVLSVGGPRYSDVSWQFAKVALERGANKVNPLQFQHTVGTGNPSTIGAIVGANSFIMTIGSGPFAFFQILERSEVLITNNIVDAIYVCASFHATPELNKSIHKNDLNVKGGDNSQMAIITSKKINDESIKFSAIHSIENHGESIFLDDQGRIENLDVDCLNLYTCYSCNGFILLKNAVSKEHRLKKFTICSKEKERYKINFTIEETSNFY